MSSLAFALFVMVMVIAQFGVARPKNRHFVFTVHGLNGSEKTFGAMPELLTQQLGELRPDEETKVYTFTYPTTKTNEGTSVFAIRLGEYIQQIIRDENIRTGFISDDINNSDLNLADRISLVSHSQGGIISWIWYYSSLNQVSRYQNYLPFAKKIDAFITLGTPIWGSRFANILYEESFYKGLINVLNTIGIADLNWKRELRELSFGSNTIYNFRQKAISLNEKNIEIPARPLVIAGVFPHSSDPEVKSLGLKYREALRIAEAFGTFESGSRLETDLVVSVPEARWDFIYTPKAKSTTWVRFSEFKKFNNPKYDNVVFLESPHMSWAQNEFYDMAEVPLKCGNMEKVCSHPTYPWVLGFLANCYPVINKDTNEYIRNCDVDAQKRIINKFFLSAGQIRHQAGLNTKALRTFSMDVSVQLPENFPVVTWPLDLKKTVDYQDPKGRFKARLNMFSEIKSSIFVEKEYDRKYHTGEGGKERHLRVHVAGHLEIPADFERKNPKAFERLFQDGFLVPWTLKVPGLKPITIEAKVIPSYSTFVEVIGSANGESPLKKSWWNMIE